MLGATRLGEHPVNVPIPPLSALSSTQATITNTDIRSMQIDIIDASAFLEGTRLMVFVEFKQEIFNRMENGKENGKMFATRRVSVAEALASAMMSTANLVIARN